MKAQDCWSLFILKLALCLALCLGLCLGCGNPAQQKAYNLQGEWTLQSLTVDGRELSGIKQAAITLVCNGTRLHGSGACNPYEARYESPQTGELKVTQQSWAEMECLDETQGLIDDAYVQALWKARKVQLNADELVLSDSTGNHRLVFIPMTGSASFGLEKTTWNFFGFETELGSGLSASISSEPPIDGAVISLRIENSQASGSSGCNQFQSSVTFADGGISIVDLTATKMNCQADLLLKSNGFSKLCGKATIAKSMVSK